VGQVCRSDFIEGLVIVRYMPRASSGGCMGLKPLLLVNVTLQQQLPLASRAVHAAQSVWQECQEES
jgi:hypothetical protein